MKMMDNMIEGFAQRAVARERKAVIAEHKPGTPFESRGQEVARRITALFGGPGSRTDTATSWALRMLGGGEVATRPETGLLDGYTHTDSSGSTKNVPGIRTHMVPGISSSVDAEIARQKAALAAAGKLNAVTEKNIGDQRPELFRHATIETINKLLTSADPVDRRRAEVIKHQIIEYVLDGTQALGLKPPASVADPKNPTPAELAALTPNELAALTAFNDTSEFLNIADTHFTEQTLEERRKKYRKRFGGPLAALAAIVIDTIKLGTSSASLDRQHA